MKEIRYYENELTDDFSGTHITPLELNDYKYHIKNPFWYCLSFFLYHLFARPILFLFMKIGWHQKVVGRKKLKARTKKGAIMYANHVHVVGDAMMPNILFMYKRNYILAAKETFSIKGIRWLVRCLGAIPLASGLHQTKDMMHYMENRLKKGHTITIFPEAHIWPYYTDIRPFIETSFKYPIHFDVPMYVLTTCFKKRKFSKRPKNVVYIDGPFYPNPDLSKEAAAWELRNLAYETMKKRSSEESTYEYIRYVKKAQNTTTN